MNLYDDWNKQVPDYYSSMYLHGYTPYQIYTAHRKQMIQNLTEQDDTTEIVITTEFEKE